ncbi:anti-sigma-I factor RsgI5-like [Palaemon carinicauda]|uniref:anti-sigma-I factor RsgI5-like n=1 Tax=Palaemon carinicauda TaxID=392227 RepID=UPI0035B5EF57
MASSYASDFLSDFIEIYRNEPCLWFIKSKDYSNREVRNAAYGKLVNKLQEIDPSANKDTVVKKINNLSSYNKELKKVQASKSLWSGSDSIYTPKLYFHLMHFIKDQNVESEPSVSNMSLNTHEINEEQSQEDDLTEKREIQHEDDSSLLPSRHTTSVLPAPPKRPRSVQGKADNVLDLVTKRMEAPPNSEYDVFGMYVAKRLQSLHLANLGMYPVVKKLINDAIFEGEMGTLTPYSRIAQNQAPSLSSTPVPTPSPSHYQAPSLSSTPVPTPSHYQAPSLSSTPVSTPSPSHYQAPSLSSTPVPTPSPSADYNYET